jgi:hypothetical protein
MKRASFIASAVIIVVANALALAHALRNRVGTPEARLTLTQRELRYVNGFPPSDDSGVTLRLEWTDPSNLPWPVQVVNPNTWLNRQGLQKLGFDCSVNPDSPDAARHYERQRSRQVFVALEYDGVAWLTWLEAYQRAMAERKDKTPFNDLIGNGSSSSHLVAINADLDPAKLRARYPDRSTVIIVPGVVAVTLQPWPYPGMQRDPKHPVQIVGRIQQLPSSIHIPRPFSDGFRRLNQNHGGNSINEPFYRVHVRYGALLEPCVTGVEFQK